MEYNSVYPIPQEGIPTTVFRVTSLHLRVPKERVRRGRKSSKRNDGRSKIDPFDGVWERNERKPRQTVNEETT